MGAVGLSTFYNKSEQQSCITTTSTGTCPASAPKLSTFLHSSDCRSNLLPLGKSRLCMMGYIAKGSTVNMLNFPKIVGFPGSTPKDIVVKVSYEILAKVNRFKISNKS